MKSPERLIAGDSDNLAENVESPEYRARMEARIELRYVEILKEPSVRNAFKYLERLPAHLVYHVKEHTENVIRETIRFAVEDDAPDEVMRQQAIAAAWHDVGFATEKIGPDIGFYAEESSAIDLFRDPDPERGGAIGLTPEEISETVGNIWDTRVLQKGGALHLEMANSRYGYILDGDVSNLGREDFFKRMNEVAKENGVDLSVPAERKGFYVRTISLLRNHTWRTESARRLRDAQKQENLRILTVRYRETLRELLTREPDEEKREAYREEYRTFLESLIREETNYENLRTLEAEYFEFLKQIE